MAVNKILYARFDVVVACSRSWKKIEIVDDFTNLSVKDNYN